MTYAKTTELDMAIKYVESLIKKENQKDLKTSGCKINKGKWLQSVLTKESFTEKISFNKECDLQGSFKVQIGKFFNVPLKIRNKKFDKTNFKIKFDILYEKVMKLVVTIKDGFLFSHKKQEFKFDTKQSFKVDPFNQKEPIVPLKKGVLNVSYLKSKKTIQI